MRIGYFSSIMGWGGSETYLLSLMQGVRERGHVPVLFGVAGTRLEREAVALDISCVPWRSIKASDVSSPDSHLVARGGKHFMPWIPRRMVPSACRLMLGNLREMRHLTRLFKRNPVDVMHVAVHGYEVAGIASRRAKIPCVGMCMITPPHESWWFRRLLTSKTLQYYDRVCSQSEYCTVQWKKIGKLPASKCSFVWSSADLTKFRAAGKISRRNTPFRIVSLGRLHPMKGYDCLINAMAELKDESFTLDIYGEGPQRDELESLVDELGLAQKISLKAYTEDPVKALQAADCFALPSVSHESCPAVLVEAMACGLPAITSDFGPLAEVNLHEQTGLVVPIGDAKALANAARRLASDDGLRLKMSANALERAKLFSRESMIDKTISLYRQAIG